MLACKAGTSVPSIPLVLALSFGFANLDLEPVSRWLCIHVCDVQVPPRFEPKIPQLPLFASFNEDGKGS